MHRCKCCNLIGLVINTSRRNDWRSSTKWRSFLFSWALEKHLERLLDSWIFEKMKRGTFTVNRRRVWSDQSFEPPPSKHWPQTDQDNIKTGCIIDDYGFIDIIDRFLWRFFDWYRHIGQWFQSCKPLGTATATRTLQNRINEPNKFCASAL